MKARAAALWQQPGKSSRRDSLNDIMRGYSDMDAGLNIRGIIDYSL